MIGLPYGERNVKLSDGSMTTVPNTLRLFRNEVSIIVLYLLLQRSLQDIIKMFTRYMKEIDKEDQLLSRSSMIRILDVCAANRRHALTCVDYFIADGTNVSFKSVL